MFHFFAATTVSHMTKQAKQAPFRFVGETMPPILNINFFWKNVASGKSLVIER